MNFEWVPSQENIEKCTTEQAKFIFEQAEKLLKDITDTNSLIVTRTTTLITITVGFMFALVGYLFNRYSIVKNLFDKELITCFCSILYTFYLCYYLVKNIQGQEYHTVGTEPKKLFKDVFFDDDITNGDQLKYFYINEIAVCQEKIRINIETNEKRWYLFNKTLRSLLYAPIAIVIIYGILIVLTFCFAHLSPLF